MLIKKKSKVRVINWSTDLSHADSIRVKKIVDDTKHLRLYLFAIKGQVFEQYEVVFTSYPCYRNINESYQNDLWKFLHECNIKTGWTFILENSNWKKELNKDSIFKFEYPEIKHYVISTEDDVIEVLSDKAPVINRLKNAKRLFQGKSIILYRNKK